MKLWVDDIRNAPDDSWTVARTVLSAIRAIHRYEFDEISLDHDISHQVSIGTGLERPYPCEETFMSVVYFIAIKYWHTKEYSAMNIARLNKVPLVTLHTSNIVAGNEMAAVLKEVGIDCNRKHMGAANRLEMEV